MNSASEDSQPELHINFGDVHISLNGRGDLEDFAKAIANAIFNSAKRVQPTDEPKPWTI